MLFFHEKSERVREREKTNLVFPRPFFLSIKGVFYAVSRRRRTTTTTTNTNTSGRRSSFF